MNGNLKESRELVDSLRKNMIDSKQVEMAIMPSFPHLPLIAERLQGSSIRYGAQDLSVHSKGAFTGEVSASMLADLGCHYAIVGHSERRQGHAESDELVVEKAQQALASGLRPIVCVGETLAEREKGDAQVVVLRQLKPLLATLNEGELAQVVIAYEPVWAIGTGLTASPEQAQEMHACIRAAINATNETAASELLILYGGSVKPENADQLFAQKDINGALVGGAALDAASFLKIHEIARESLCTE